MPSNSLYVYFYPNYIIPLKVRVPNITNAKPIASSQRNCSQPITRLLNQMTKVRVGVRVAPLVADAYFLTETPEAFRIAIVNKRVNYNQKTLGYSKYYSKAFEVFSRYPNSLQ